jgi:hypothetical protein
MRQMAFGAEFFTRLIEASISASNESGTVYHAFVAAICIR